MGILSEFERRLEGVIEGVFARAFRSGLHPVEIARRVLKEMEAGKTVGVHGVWVPNHFLVTLSPSDRERFAGTEKVLGRELAQVAREGAGERGWGFVGPPEVTFATDASLRQGEFTVEASLREGPTGWDLPPAEPAAERPPHVADERSPAAGGAADLVLLRDGLPARTIELALPRTILGRLPESDVVIDDPGASRRHAEIRREDGEYVVADLGSTNGTLVNDRTVGERTLQDGDVITIGHTMLEFRRR